MPCGFSLTHTQIKKILHLAQEMPTPLCWGFFFPLLFNCFLLSFSAFFFFFPFLQPGFLLERDSVRTTWTTPGQKEPLKGRIPDLPPPAAQLLPYGALLPTLLHTHLQHSPGPRGGWGQTSGGGHLVLSDPKCWTWVASSCGALSSFS